MYRGRLIFPFMMEVARLDLASTQNAGYDPEFLEPTILPTTDGLGASARAETLVRLLGSFHSPQSLFQLQQALTGNLQKVDVLVLFHFAELERVGLVEQGTGMALIKVGDRLNAIYDKRSGTLVQQVPNPPGAFVTKASPIFGLNSFRNLLEVTFTSRDQGSSSAGG